MRLISKEIFAQIVLLTRKKNSFKKWPLKGACDARTLLEGRAYSNFIIANFEFEQQQWESCLTRFTASQKIYTSLAETLPADEAPVYAEFAAELEPNLRYCQYNLGEKADQSLLR